jgi:hypothetical protein
MAPSPARYLLLLAFSLVAAACGPSTPPLTIAQTQAAVDEWLTQPNTPNGSARVIAVKEIPGQGGVVAELRTLKFLDEDGHISPTEDPAQAVFSQSEDGTWRLTKVIWDEGRVTAEPNLVVR